MPVSTEVIAHAPNKPALVLIHGLGSAGTIWKSLHDGLQEHFVIHPIDLPGHGSAELGDEPLDPRSLAHAIAEMMETEHQVREFHVAGNSLGDGLLSKLRPPIQRELRALLRLHLLGSGLKGLRSFCRRVYLPASWQNVRSIFYVLRITCRRSRRWAIAKLHIYGANSLLNPVKIQC